MGIALTSTGQQTAHSNSGLHKRPDLGSDLCTQIDQEPDFGDALRRTGQLAFDLGLRHVPIAYSWPSQGTVFGYVADRTTVAWTARHLSGFLTELSQNLAAPAAIHLIAHSMGSDALTAALLAIRAQIPAGPEPFAQLVLTAPDLDAAVFERDLGPQLIGTASRTTLYASSRDEVLSISKRLNAHRRAGDSDDGIVLVPGMDSIDASNVSTGFGHSVFGDVRSVVEDIATLLTTGLGPTDRNLLPQGLPPKRWWAFAR
jgi:esterase/lipase superfamily enzyme